MGPTGPFDPDEGLDVGSRRAPSGEEGEIAIGDVTPDQQAAGPQPGSAVVIVGGVEIGQFEIRPVMQAGTFGAVARRQAGPIGGGQTLRDRPGGSGNRPRLSPRGEGVIGTDAQHIAVKQR